MIIVILIFIKNELNPKTAVGEGRGQFDNPPPPPHPCGFSKNLSSKGRVKPCFFLFDFIISHIFPENFIEIPEVFQKL